MRSNFDNNNLGFPKVMSKIGCMAFRYCEANTWNSLPTPIRAYKTVIKCKLLCKTFILNTTEYFLYIFIILYFTIGFYDRDR